MSNLASPIHRPRLVREGPVNIDEKMATLFVDKAMRAVQADLDADRGINESLRRHGHSLGNVIGQQRFLDRMARSAGCSTVYLAGYPSKKAFLMIRDILHVYESRLSITRTTAIRRQRKPVEVGEWETLMISRHALIRAVQRIQVGSVDDVFRLLKIMWMSVERLLLAVSVSKVVTTGTSCWVLPMMLGKMRMGLLVSCPQDEPLSLVTILRPYMIPDAVNAALDDYQRALAETMDEKERTDALLAILPRLVV